MNLFEGVRVAELKNKNTGWRQVHVILGALVIIDEHLWGGAEKLRAHITWGKATEQTLSFKLLV